MLPPPAVAALRRYGLAALVFVAVLGLTVSTYQRTLREDDEVAHRQFQFAAAEQIAHLRDRSDNLVRHVDILRRQLAFVPAEARARFGDIVAPLLARHPEIQRLGILRLDAGEALITAAAGPRPSGAGQPLPDSADFPDPAHRSMIRDTLHAAAGARRSLVSAPFPVLAADGRSRNTILIVGPISRDDAAASGELFFIELPVEAMLDAALQPAIDPDLNRRLAIEIVDSADPGHVVYRSADFHLGDGAFADHLEMADRRWLVIATGSSADLRLPRQEAGGQLFSGLALGALAALVLYVLQTRADAIRRQVDDKTLALGDANTALEQYVKALGETNRLLESEVAKHTRSESLLRETTTLQRAILDCAEYAIVYTDSAGVIRVFNPAAERLFGYRADELIGRQTPLIFHTAEDVAHWTLARQARGFAAIASAVGAGSDSAREMNMRRRDGSIFPASLSISEVLDSHQQVRGYLGIIADNTQRREAERRIRHLAHYDSLTSLPNRTLLASHLADVIGDARARQRGVAVLFTDLDRFKYVNDTLGHQAGDELLLAVAHRLRACVRDGDLVARTGGDEFVVVLGNLGEGSLPEDAAERILDSLARPFELQGHQFTVTVSIGIALYPHDGLDGAALVKNADAAMYLAKERGRNNYQFFDHSLSARLSERLELESRLRHALDENQLELFYQPQVDTLSGELIGTEALIRWRQPDGSMVPPDKFIPIAEESGLIVPIGAWVLHEACRQNSLWQQEDLCRVPVGVNLSARQFDDTGLLATIQSALADSGLPAASLDLELTESLVMRNPEHTRNVLAECKRIGLQLSVDDFGTGYSSLANLKRFPIDRLKIDRSFIDEIVTQADDAAIARTIVAMAHTLRLEVVAEGVETDAQLALLRRWRCDAYQGYVCSRPLSAADMTGLLRTRRATREIAVALP